MISPRDTLKRDHLLRKPYCIDERDATGVVIDNQRLIHFCSNDYFNLSTDRKVKKAFLQGVAQYGLGSGSACQIAGFHRPHRQLEDAFSDFLQREKTLLFNSGYHANLAVLSTLANRHSLLLLDKYCHASLIDGARLSRATYVRFAHNDLFSAEKILKKHKQPSTLLVTESVFGMSGHISPVKEYAALTEKYRARLIVDDAHGLGILGKQGKGSAEFFNLSQDNLFCLISPLGKALGSLGAIVSGSFDLIEHLLQFSRTHRYTTALPPAICVATLMALMILQKETERREKLRYLITYFKKSASARKINLISNDPTPIQAILLNDNHKALQLQKKLFDKGFLVSCIRPPTVPTGMARLKISLNFLHTEAHITQLLDTLAEIRI